RYGVFLMKLLLFGPIMKNFPLLFRMIANGTDPGRFEFQASLVRAINEASPDGILVVDATDTIVSHNRRFIDVWGMPEEYRDGNSIGRSDQPILAMAVERVKNQAVFLARVKELYANPELDDHCEIELKDGRTLERHSTVLR